MVQVLRYVTAAGVDVFGQWLTQLTDVRARAKIAARVARLAVGNFGDCKSLRHGVYELRIHFGPGYRVYYAMHGRSLVVLLCAGQAPTICRHRSSCELLE
jgi:putative addiction module killer protein